MEAQSSKKKKKNPHRHRKTTKALSGTKDILSLISVCWWDRNILSLISDGHWDRDISSLISECWWDRNVLFLISDCWWDRDRDVSYLIREWRQKKWPQLWSQRHAIYVSILSHPVTVCNYACLCHQVAVTASDTKTHTNRFVSKC